MIEHAFQALLRYLRENLTEIIFALTATFNTVIDVLMSTGGIKQMISRRFERVNATLGTISIE